MRERNQIVGDHHKIMDWDEEVNNQRMIWLLDDQLNQGWEFVTILQKSYTIIPIPGKDNTYQLIPAKLLFRKVKS